MWLEWLSKPVVGRSISALISLAALLVSFFIYERTGKFLTAFWSWLVLQLVIAVLWFKYASSH